jgi:hypothetical protein
MLLAGVFLSKAPLAGIASVAAIHTASGVGPVNPHWPATQELVYTEGRDVRRLIAAEARAAQLKVLELRAGRPPVPALIAVFQTREAARFLAEESGPLVDAYRRAQTSGTPIYLALADGNGALVWSAGWVPGEETMFVSRQLEACNPLPQPGPMYDRPAPPCPA